MYTLFSHKQEWNFVTCNNMDESQGLHAKWKKSDKERKYSIISHIWNFKKKKIIKHSAYRYREQTDGCLRWEDGVE